MEIPQPVTIQFAIEFTDSGYDPASGTWTIVLDSALPVITRDDLTLDGTSQTTFSGDANPLGPELVVRADEYAVDVGFALIHASRNRIQGFVIGGFLYGIQIFGAGASDNAIVGNTIGMDATGTLARPNYNGIELLSGAHHNIVGGTTLQDRNLVSGNRHIGIRISDAYFNVVSGNLAGVDRTGTLAVPNCDGISVEGNAHDNVIGGLEPGAGNVASGNWAYGIDVFGAGAAGNLIVGNLIGTDITGHFAVPNTYGVLFDDRAHQNVVGGVTESARNIISGNTAFGAYIYNNTTRENSFVGNFIGTNAAGDAAIPNESGVWIDGGAVDNTVEDNLISGNLISGVTLFASLTDRNAFRRNVIGADIAHRPLGNGLEGIRISQGPCDTLIGGSPSDGNVIAYNGRNGIVVESDDADGNLILSNSVWGNKIMGIDLYPIGPNPNDAGDLDEGPNQQMNTPIIETVRLTGGDLELSGWIDTQAPETIDVAVYVSDCGHETAGQGKIPLGIVQPDETGLWTWSGPAVSGTCFTATATDALGNTSEFAPIFDLNGTVVASPVPSSFTEMPTKPRNRDMRPPHPRTPRGRKNGTIDIARVAAWFGTGTGSPDRNRVVFVVTHTGDEGAGSLTDAIGAAQLAGEPSTIIFQLPTTDPGFDAMRGVWTFALAEPLPLLAAGDLTIDGTSQTAFASDTNPLGPEIELLAAGTVEYALGIVSSRNTIAGFAIGGFACGVVIWGGSAEDNEIRANFIGIDALGQAAAANQCGVLLSQGTSGNRVQGNVISGNWDSGVACSSSNGNQIEGNLIGTDASGEGAVPNTMGMVLTDSGNNQVGGNAAGTGNVISGNLDAGLLLTGRGSTDNTIQGNLIGVDLSGEAALPNNKGIVIKTQGNENLIGGCGSGLGNVISGNLQIGIYIEASDGNRIQGNVIGLNASGTQFVTLDGSPAQGNGVEFNTCASGNLLGGEDATARNIISGHRVYGVVYYGNCEQNTTAENFIGTDITGTYALPNATGICFDCASHHNTLRHNVISGNLSYGLFLVTRGTAQNLVQSNLIGTDASGYFAIPNDIGLVIATGASENVIGGDDFSEGNLISGNRRSGIMLTNSRTSSNILKFNQIGTNIDGQAAVPNAHGVLVSTLASGNTLHHNLISGNAGAGVLLYEYAQTHELTENLIGTDRTGLAPLGNGSAGVFIDQGAHDHRIGMPGKGNVIAFNGAGGVLVTHDHSLGNSVSENRMFGNGGLGVDLFPWGINPIGEMDADSGPNAGMNAPIISTVCTVAASSQIDVQGFLSHESPDTTTIEVFAADDSLPGQGMQHLISTLPDPTGYWSITVPIPASSDAVTALAIDARGNASEFAMDVPIDGASCFRLGDLDLSGIIDATDLAILASHAEGWLSHGQNPFIAPQAAADLDGVPGIDARDAEALGAALAHRASWIDPAP